MNSQGRRERQHWAVFLTFWSMSWIFSGLNLFPLLFPLLAPFLSHITYPGQILCFPCFHRPTPHEKKLQAGKEGYKMKPDFTHHVTDHLYTLEPDGAGQIRSRYQWPSPPYKPSSYKSERGDTHERIYMSP